MDNLPFLKVKSDINLIIDQSKVFKGIPSSLGLAMGQAIVYSSNPISEPSELITSEKIVSEIGRLEKALESLVNEYQTVIQKTNNQHSSVISILETNLMIISDELLKEALIRKIENGYSVESAVITEFEEKIQYFLRTKDKILKERGYELEHLKERLFDILRNRSIIDSIKPDTILVVRSLTTADLINAKEAGLIGIITEVGGIASHVSILARNFGLPAVIGVKYATELISASDLVILDGYSGTVISNPNEEQLNEFYKKKNKEEYHKQELGELAKVKSETTDKVRIELHTNVDNLEEIETSLLNGADGIGLVRSENYIDSLDNLSAPESQYKLYRELAQRAYPNNVVIRAFDFGGDKRIEGLPFHEENPALGMRGIKFLLLHLDIFEAQINAVLQASKNKNVKFMIPMVSSIEEFTQSLQIIEDCKKKLSSEGISFDYNMPIGAMIETPSAVLLAEKFAEITDFMSIGTNDLVQYTLAVDRNNALISNFYNSFHISVLKQIYMVAQAGRNKKKPVSICGELAGHPSATTLLVGMGINQLSVAPSILPELKSRILKTSYKSATKLVKKVLKLHTDEEIREVLNL